MDGPALGILLHMIGGLAAASFYIPYGRVKNWSWEAYWLVGGVFSWIVAPWILALIITPDLFGVLRESWNASRTAFVWAYLFGAMWGVGGLTFGLTMRYLGISLGMAIALGYCAVVGTLLPPIVKGEFAAIVTSVSGIVILVGVAVCVAGIAVTGLAGIAKERELNDDEKKQTVKEFNFWKGLLTATFSGVMSAGMAFGIAAGRPIAELAVERGTPALLGNLPILCVVLAGGFTTNFLWCVALNVKNRSAREYLDFAQPQRWLANLCFSALAGVTWYMQFFFYGMGETKIGEYRFSSWTLHMASIILFSTCWGIALHEWRGSSSRTFRLLAAGLAALVLSMVVVGYGNKLAADAPPTAPPSPSYQETKTRSPAIRPLATDSLASSRASR
ncbi:MAG TPA: L-rhamnose/proton symporter RhaT [Planctomycetaceae bacterium]|nr:L-rhamnose/proton symporter RhaT [Planctomycetaceae bacterium]